MKYDYLLRKGTVVDGSGSSSFVGDVGVKDGRIVSIGNLAGDVPAHEFDCTGLIVCPGFIDMHGHSELEALRAGHMYGKIAQGITSEVAGNCGVGVYPLGVTEQAVGTVREMTRDVLGDYDGAWNWTSFGSFVDKLAVQGIGTNMAFLQAHSALRCAVIEGNPNRAATSREVCRMVELLEQALDEGCVGFSSGLYYAPCMFADRAELLALLSATARKGKIFAVHHRCEGDDVLSSLKEVLDLARETGVRLEVSHLKAIGRKNQDEVPRMLQMIEEYRAEGVDVLFDQYPYEYGSTSLFSLLPPEYLRLSRNDLRQRLGDSEHRAAMRRAMERPDGWDSIYELCGWEDISVVSLDATEEYNGMSISDIAAKRSQEPFDAFFDILAQESGAAVMVDTTQTEESLKLIMRHPLGCFGTDALYSGDRCHPRSWAAAVHLLDKYWRQEEVLPLEQMIRRMTYEPARRLGLLDRGLVKGGFQADLVVFDPLTIHDNATVLNPTAMNAGMELVMVSGVPAYHKGSFANELSGSILVL
ncbi:MAG: D-aminoacylase [Sphaerochaetaceae bacterium]|nr:D-aminoacylase [Sphaerochaetaceae bacterium]